MSSSTQRWQMDRRALALCDWLTAQFGPARAFESISGDASFRRYFRFQGEHGDTIIGVDAPPDKENSEAFLQVAWTLRSAGVRVPDVLASDLKEGWLALEDLGDVQLFKVLNQASVDAWYSKALAMLEQVAKAPLPDDWPCYTAEHLQREMSLFVQWLLDRHLQWSWSAREKQLWDATADRLTRLALGQPTVCVHRDYHSRNLMCLPDGTLAALDFQDALRGPVTYDAVSLTKDCYVRWPTESVDSWLLAHRQRLMELPMDLPSEDQWLYWADTMGMQRHLKAAGIFARLWHRDGKSGYLADVPRTLTYLVDASRRHGEFRDFGRWIEDAVLPRFLETDVEPAP